MRDPRREAAERIGHRWDVRVLEPSPPAVIEPPYLADDPVDGGEVVPVRRAGSRSWSELCTEGGAGAEGAEGGADPSRRSWCEDRWLVRRATLDPCPTALAETRRSLHAVAEHVLAPARHRATGKIGLRYTYHGFGTPYFGDDRQLRVEDGDLVDETGRRAPITTLQEAARFAGTPAGAIEGLYEPATPLDLDAALPVDRAAATSIGDWFGLCASLLEQLRADAGPGDTPARIQLWPEHFDLAVDLGPEGGRANYGGSPGDAGHAEPYLYIGPWDPAIAGGDEFWNEPFGASLSHAEILAGADPLAFFARGKALLGLLTR